MSIFDPSMGARQKSTPKPTGPFAPPARTKVAIYDAVTGERIERWSIDARAMVATGEYTYDPPDDALPPAA